MNMMGIQWTTFDVVESAHQLDLGSFWSRNKVPPGEKVRVGQQLCQQIQVVRKGIVLFVSFLLALRPGNPILYPLTRGIRLLVQIFEIKCGGYINFRRTFGSRGLVVIKSIMDIEISRVMLATMWQHFNDRRCGDGMSSVSRVDQINARNGHDYFWNIVVDQAIG